MDIRSPVLRPIPSGCSAKLFGEAAVVVAFVSVECVVFVPMAPEIQTTTTTKNEQFSNLLFSFVLGIFFCIPSIVEFDGAVAAGGGDAGIVVKFGIAVSASTPCT